MSTFHFTLIVDGPELQDQPLIDRLFEAGCGNATAGFSDGVQYVDSDRVAGALDDAILSAIDDLEQLKGVEVIRITDAGLVSLADIAARAGRTRENARLLVSGTRGPGKLPKPVTNPHNRHQLWRWSESRAGSGSIGVNSSRSRTNNLQRCTTLLWKSATGAAYWSLPIRLRSASL